MPPAPCLYFLNRIDSRSAPIVCCAFELLRLDNYLLQPTLENVRVLAALAAILRIQANPAASWSLLGKCAAAHRVVEHTANTGLRNGYSGGAIHRHTLRAATYQGFFRH